MKRIKHWINGELVNGGEQGAAVFESKYDYNNNLIEQRYFDKNGELSTSKFNVSIWQLRSFKLKLK